METINTIELLAAKLYQEYCIAVGGKSFNGEDLPEWETFAKDSRKALQAEGWRKVARESCFWLGQHTDQHGNFLFEAD